MTMRAFDNVKHSIRKLEGVLELLLLSLIYFLMWRVAYRDENLTPYYGRGKYVLAGVYFLIQSLLFYNNEGFKFGHLKLLDTVISQWIAVTLGNMITYAQLCLTANRLLNPEPMLALTGVDLLVTLGCSYLFSKIYHRFYIPRNMLMIYGNINAITLKAKMDTRQDKYRVRKLVSADVGLPALKKLIPKYDAIVITDIEAPLRNDIVKFCFAKGIRMYITPKITDVITRGADTVHLFDTPLILVHSSVLNYEQRFVKRAVDIFLSLLVLLVTWPIMLIIAIAIKQEDGGPVFFRQRRVTRWNREFDILKFRSMIVDAEKSGISVPATERDPRITRVGRILRATRLDELPQVFNILKNDMSVVGPRPERVEHVKAYTEMIPEFAFRTKVKGGLTGYAQIFGKYNTSPYDKLKLDLMYIENYSLQLDLKLILMTLSVMLKKESTEGFDKILTPEEILAEMSAEDSGRPEE